MIRGERWWASGTAVVVWIALGTVVVHLVTGWRYGFDRDELMALEDARHLAWGYVQYPPMTAFFGWVALKLFGTSLVGFRLFAAVAQALAVVLTGLMAKEIYKAVASGEWGVASGETSELTIGPPEEEADSHVGNRLAVCPEENDRRGICHTKDVWPRRGSRCARNDGPLGMAGERWAMVVAALAGVPFCLGAGALMQYISFDYLCWVVVAFGVVKVASRGEKRKEEVEEFKSGKVEESEGTRAEKSEEKSGPTLSAKSADRVGQPGGDGGDEVELADRLGRRSLQTQEWWWLVVGAGIGLGMLAKYTMLFLVCGVVAGILFTPMRRHLRSGWLWLGVFVAVGIFAPNLAWEWRHGFVSLDFLRFLHVRDVGEGLTDWFLVGQLEITLLAAPLALAGLWFCLFTKEGRRFRILGWMYVVPLVLYLVMRGRDYYLAPGYPMLYAMGAVWVERKWRGTRSEEVEECKSERVEELQELETRAPATTVECAEKQEKEEKGRPLALLAMTRLFEKAWLGRVIWVCLILDVVVAGAVALPVAPVNSGWWRFASQVDSVFPEEIGWPEFVEAVAQVRDRLPVEERGRVTILAGNYGEVGALNLYGEKYELPRAISGVNSSWERGYGDPAEVVIVVGYSREFLQAEFGSCEVGGRVWNRYGVMNEETIEDPEIFVCRGLKGSWEAFWRKVRKFA